MPIQSIFRSKFLTSPYSLEIKQIINAHKGRRPLTEIYAMIKQVDKDVPKYPTFVHFMRRYDRSVKSMRKEIAKDIMDESLKDIDLINVGINKAMRLGNMVMAETFKEIKEKMDNGETIDWQERKNIMNWYKGAAEMYYEGATLKLKEKDGIRESIALGVLAKAARAGTLKGGDIEFIEGEFAELKVEAEPILENNDDELNAKTNQTVVPLPSEALPEGV